MVSPADVLCFSHVFSEGFSMATVETTHKPGRPLMGFSHLLLWCWTDFALCLLIIHFIFLFRITISMQDPVVRKLLRHCGGKTRHVIWKLRFARESRNCVSTGVTFAKENFCRQIRGKVGKNTFLDKNCVLNTKILFTIYNTLWRENEAVCCMRMQNTLKRLKLVQINRWLIQLITYSTSQKPSENHVIFLVTWPLKTRL